VNVNAKLGNMRKAVDWTVYPEKKDGRIIIQAEHYIAMFKKDGDGLLSKRQQGGAYFVHLSPMCGAEPVKVPPEVVQDAIKAQSMYKKLDEGGEGVILDVMGMIRT
jgi:hypothetical protein